MIELYLPMIRLYLEYSPFTILVSKEKGGQTYVTKALITSDIMSSGLFQPNMELRNPKKRKTASKKTKLYALLTTTEMDVDIAAHALNSSQEEKSHKIRSSIYPRPVI